MELELIRTYYPNGTNGMLMYEQRLLCYTIELPWLDNARKLSCIPEGKYKLTMRYSIKHGTHLLVNNVPGRALILIHPANNASAELQGCIAPVTKLAGKGKGYQSRMALEQLNELVFRHIDEEPIFLTIKSKQL